MIYRKATISQIAKQFNIAAKTVRRWVKRKMAGLPYRLRRAAKNVWNRTKEKTVNEIRYLLEQANLPR